MATYASLAGVEVGDGFPVRVIGVINVSPESFYQGSVPHSQGALQDQAARMEAEGADLLDIGGMSTAPYLETEVSQEEESRRLSAAIGVVRKTVKVPLSADTKRSRVALAALDAGAQVINDVSGLRHDPEMAELVARRAEGVILMASGPAAPNADDPVGAVRGLLEDSLRVTWKAGIPAHRVVLDPGIGFFRNAPIPWDQWDCEVLRRLGDLSTLDHPIVVGVSRKSFLGKILEKTDPADRLAGSLAATVVAVLNGARAIRTHDVGPTRDAVRVAEALRPK